MNPESTSRESQRVAELANEYKSRGYDVLMPRTLKDNPAFLRDSQYIPDLIARSKDENLVIEVKSRHTSGSLDKISGIAELVNSQPGWTFVLVFTNARSTKPLLGQPNEAKAIELLEKSITLGSSDQAHVEAAFLFAWAALEASLHLLPDSTRHTRTLTSAWTLVRDAAMSGSISRSDANDLGRLYKMRNSLLHAGDASSPTFAEVKQLRNFVQELLQQASREEV